MKLKIVKIDGVVLTNEEFCCHRMRNAYVKEDVLFDFERYEFMFRSGSFPIDRSSSEIRFCQFCGVVNEVNDITPTESQCEKSDNGKHDWPECRCFFCNEKRNLWVPNET